MSISDRDADAVFACVADGVDPNQTIAGKPAWKYYTKAAKMKVSDAQPSELTAQELAAFVKGAERETAIKQLNREHDAEIAILRKTLIGKFVKQSDTIYQITHVMGWNGRIEAKGRKITKTGKLGTQNWNLRRLRAEDFKR